jgi:uncharacterized protein (UPF0332 family)
LKSEKEIIEYRLSKSAAAFRSAEVLTREEDWNAVVSRLYYASYYAVSALIYQSGEKAKTHSGLKGKFHELFIRTGKLSEQAGETYETLFHNRHDADYADFVEFDREEVFPLLDETTQFLQEVRKQIKI